MEVMLRLLLLLMLRLLLLIVLLLVLCTLFTMLLTLTPGTPPPALAGASNCSRDTVAAGSFDAAATKPPCAACGGVATDAATPVAAGACRRTSTATESASRSQLVASPSACPVKS